MLTCSIQQEVSEQEPENLKCSFQRGQKGWLEGDCLLAYACIHIYAHNDRIFLIVSDHFTIFP